MEQDPKKPAAATVKRVRSFKTESETQTAVAVRVPSLKKPQPQQQQAAEAAAEKLVTAEQTQNASIARRRRMITKNKAQSVKTREKTPEPSRPPVLAQNPQDDSPVTDEEEAKRSPEEAEADDIYAEMRKKLEEQKLRSKDDDDIDIGAIREAQAEEAKERRRRSISPFALPSMEELAQLRRKGSFIDPGNKLLTTVPNYTVTIKDEHNFDVRKSSLIAPEDIEHIRKTSLTSPPSPSLTTPPSPKWTTDSAATASSSIKRSNTSDRIHEAKKISSQPLPTKQTAPVQKAPRPCIKASTNANETNNAPNPNATQSNQSATPHDVPPVRPKRSKSGTRSQGRTSESEMSEDQSKPKTKSRFEAHKAPKPKERRRTIGAVKLEQPIEQLPQAVQRSKSVTRSELLDVTGIELTKTSSEIIDLLQKVKDRKSSVSNDDENDEALVANAIRTYFDRTKQLVTPTKTPSTPRKGLRITSPKKIEPLSDKEAMKTFKEAQRKSMEIERSRRNSGYVDASQSEVTSSYCSSSSYSEDESDFDLSKKTAELEKKLAQLKSEKEPIVAKSKVETVVSKKREKQQPKKNGVKKKQEEPSPPPPPSEPKKSEEIEEKKKKIKVEIKVGAGMLRNLRPVWRQFRAEHPEDWTLLKRMWNRCFSDLLLLLLMCGLGGLVFRYTEGAFENFYKCGVKRVKRDFIDALWQSSHNMREDDWKSLARNKLWDFETQLHAAHEAGVHSYSGQKSWSFLNAMVYCLTVVTTIGYGHIAPSTTTGRAITIVYAIFGIPIFLILLADFGKLFTRGIKFLWAFVRRLYMTGSCRKARKTAPVQEVMKGLNIVASSLRRPSQYILSGDFAKPEAAPRDVAVNDVDVDDDTKPPPLPPKPRSMSLLGVPGENNNGDEEVRGGTEVGDEERDIQTPALSTYEVDDEFNLPISVAITILVIYILMGASIYVVWEEWGFFESFYFVFISMSTIGFGDYVPNHPIYMMGSILYLAFGLALTSMCINVVQVKLSNSFRQASAKIGATIGLKVSEEDGSLHPVTPPPIEMPEVHGAAATPRSLQPSEGGVDGRAAM